jgi:alpha-tubulin suppressor-like RCC1 family protein
LEELKTIWDPRLIYPTEDHQDILSLQNQYDAAVQIEAFEDTSFLLTEEGYLFSWGFSDNGFLGREPTLDLKQFFESKNKKNLPFSN